MKKIILLGLVGFIIYYVFFNANTTNKTFHTDGRLELSNSSTRAILFEDANIDLNLRLYSIDSNKSPHGLFSLIDHAFFVTPFSGSRGLYARYVNKNMPMNKPTMVQVLTDNDEIDNEILNFKKNGYECVEVSAIVYTVDELYFKGELVTNYSTTGHDFDPMKMILVEEFRPNNCD